MSSAPTRPLTRLAAAVALAAVTGSLAGQTVVNVPCAADNTLYESASGSLSNGAGFGLFVGLTGQPAKRRALLRFDVAAAVPAGSRILDARLELNVSRTAVAIPVDVAMHRVLRAWGEGTSNAPSQEGQGALATNGDATWIHAIRPGSFWTTPGGDFAPAASGVITTPSLGPCTSAFAAGAVADVQGWLDAPAQNFGWLLKTNEALAYVARRFDSRESTLGPPPRLVVTYLAPGQTATWGTGCPVNGQPFTTAWVGNATGGSTLQLTQSNGPANALAVNLIGLQLDAAGSPLLPQCRLYLPLGGLIVTNNLLTLGAGGGGSTPFAVPSGFPGVQLVAQAAALTQGGTSFVLSSAAVAVLQ